MRPDPTRTKTLIRSFDRAVSASIQRYWLRVKPLIFNKLQETLQLNKKQQRSIQWIQLSVITDIDEILDRADEQTLRRELRGTTRKYLSAGYNKGGAKAQVDLNRINIDYHFDLTRGDIEAIGILSDQGFLKMNEQSQWLKSEYTRVMSKGMLEGHSIPKMTKGMMEATGKAKVKCRRVARTETINAYAQGAINQYKKAGVKKWRWIGTGDERSCDICPSLDGQVFEMGDPQPPKHPNCRCAVAPVVDEKAPPLPRRQPRPKPVPIRIPPFEKIKDLKTLEQWANNKYKTIAFDFKGGHVDTIKPTLKQFGKLSAKYPYVAKRLKYFGTYKNPAALKKAGVDSSSFGSAFAHASNNGKRIGLNPVYYGNPEKFASRLKDAVNVGWFPKGSGTYEAILTHEFGHQVYNHYSYTNPEMRNKAFNKIVGIDGLGDYSSTLTTWQKAHKGTFKLSRYSLKNIDERWAEAFTAMHHSPPDITTLSIVREQSKLIKFFDESKSYAKGEWSWSNDIPKDTIQWENYLKWREQINKYLTLGERRL